MQRNLEQEMDELKKQVDEIRNLLLANEKTSNNQEEFEGNIQYVQLDSATRSIHNPSEDTRGLSHETGRVAYQGVFKSGGLQTTQFHNQIDTDKLLSLIEIPAVEKILNCIGNNDRLNILLALLKEPMTVASLVAKCGYNSTGQVYHHLKPLLAAGLIAENKNASRGTYVVVPHRVQGIIMLLAGIHDMIDMNNSEVDWEIHTGARMVDERYMATNEEAEKIIKTYFTSLKPLELSAFPPKEKKKLVILKVISKEFEAGRRYSEKEVNLILKSIYNDYATIRRYLIEYGFMERTRDCREYWLKDARTC